MQISNNFPLFKDHGNLFAFYLYVESSAKFANISANMRPTSKLLNGVNQGHLVIPFHKKEFKNLMIQLRVKLSYVKGASTTNEFRRHAKPKSSTHTFGSQKNGKQINDKYRLRYHIFNESLTFNVAICPRVAKKTMLSYM